MIFTFFIFLKEILSQPERIRFEDHCFSIIGNNAEPILIPSNPSIQFIPEVMGVEIHMEEISTDNQIRKRETKLFVRKTDEFCYKGFQVPDLRKPNTDNITIKIEIFWGDRFTIDQSKMIMTLKSRPRNEERAYNYPGESSNIEFHLYFNPETEFRRYSKPEIAWTKKLTGIDCRLHLCARIFNHIPIYSFLRTARCRDKLPALHQYNYLRIVSYSDTQSATQVSRKEFLAEIYQCSPEIRSQYLTILVDDSIARLAVSIASERDGNAYKMQLFKHGGNFYSEPVDQMYHALFNVEVKQVEFDQAWTKRSQDILLHRQNMGYKHCVVEGKNDVKLYFVVHKEKKYLERSLSWSENSYLRIKYAQKASSEEEEWCRAF